MSVTVDTTSQRFTSGPQPEADIVVIHTTECMGWPGYSGGGDAPHATIQAIPGVGILVREHIPEEQYAKALMNLPGGVETNRRGVLQYEFMGTCDPAAKGRMYYWAEADDKVMAAVADYLRSKMVRWGIPFTAPAFQAYSASFGPRGGTNLVRMSGAEWNAYQGVVGHQHVPENVHGDPGAFPVGKLIAFLKGSSTNPVVAEPVKAPPVYIPPKLTVDGAFGLNTVKALQRWLGAFPDGDWGPASKRALQRKLGVRIDGLIGTLTIRALQKKVGAKPDGVWGKNTTMALQRFLNTL
jgi:hypothetical protein